MRMADWHETPDIEVEADRYEDEMRALREIAEGEAVVMACPVREVPVDELTAVEVLADKVERELAFLM